MQKTTCLLFGLFLFIFLNEDGNNLFSQQEQGITSRTESKGCFVLCYHTFFNKEHVFTDFSEQAFEQQLDVLKNSGFTFISFSDIADNTAQGTKNVLITLDDGHKTAYNVYKKILRPRGIKPIFAIYPAIIGKKDFAMTWEQIREVSEEGCVIASHGYYHLYVDESLYAKNKKEFLWEVVKSKEVLEKQLGKPVTIFVYPFGKRSPFTQQHLKGAGYTFAFNLKGGYCTLPPAIQEGFTEMPRYLVTNKNWKGIFQVILRKK